MFWPEILIATLFGLLIGSFLNVCIFRLPYDLSVARPRSFCPSCERTIAWHDNLPVLSYLILRGRCRHCAEPIHWRYPLVELLTGLVFGSAVIQYGLTPAAGKLALFSCLTIICIFTDFAERILPDEITLGGTVAGLLMAYWVPIAQPRFLDLFLFDYGLSEPTLSVIEALFGGLFPSVTIYAVGALYFRIRGREGLGFGDVKLIMMFGSFFGFSPTLITLLLASLFGSVGSLVYLKLNKKDSSTYELPFGSFLGIVALLVQHAAFLIA